MPNAAVFTTVLPPLLIGAGMLMIMDASINVTMEPFRALIADNLNSKQRSLGFSVQTFLIGIGAVVGSWLPYVLAEYFDVSKVAEQGVVPDNVIVSFYFGAAVLIVTILWTVFSTKEYSPTELASFDDASVEDGERISFLKGLLVSIKQMPLPMRQLGLVQFFSWFALFLMWVFTTPAIAEHIYAVQAGDTTSLGYADAGNWVGILFGIYNAVSAIYALCLPKVANRLGRKGAHGFSLLIGGLSLLSIYFIGNPNGLILPMIGIGIAWGSILAMPYAILSDSIPSHKMGLYMGLFNFFITFPQIVSGLTGGFLIKYVFQGQAIYGLVLSGVLMLFAAWSVVRIKE
jgi:maltose/moltooligosaccharide transporter